MNSPVEMALHLRRTRRGRQPRIPRPGRQPIGLGLERKYAGQIRGLIDPARDLIAELLLPQLERIGRMAGVGLRRDAEHLDAEPWADVVAAIMAAVRQQYDAETSSRIAEVVTNTGLGGDAFNAGAVRRQISAMLGVDLAVEMPEIGPLLQSWGQDNVGLITSIPERYFAEVEGLVLRSFNSGVRAEEIAPQIRNRFGVSEARANLIARDQIGKLQGDLTRKRQLGLGINLYRWRTSQDERVRSSHRELARRKTKYGIGIYSWDDPPRIPGTDRRAHPGQDYQCRCTAEPYIDDLLGDETDDVEPLKLKKVESGLYKTGEYEIRKGPGGWAINGPGYDSTQFGSLAEVKSELSLETGRPLPKPRRRRK